MCSQHVGNIFESDAHDYISTCISHNYIYEIFRATRVAEWVIIKPQAVTLPWAVKLLQHLFPQLCLPFLVILHSKRGKLQLMWSYCCTTQQITVTIPLQKKVPLAISTPKKNISVHLWLVYVSFKHLDVRPVIIMTPKVASLRGAHEGTTCLSYAELTVTDCFCRA